MSKTYGFFYELINVFNIDAVLLTFFILSVFLFVTFLISEIVSGREVFFKAFIFLSTMLDLTLMLFCCVSSALSSFYGKMFFPVLYFILSALFSGIIVLVFNIKCKKRYSEENKTVKIISQNDIALKKEPQTILQEDFNDTDDFIIDKLNGDASIKNAEVIIERLKYYDLNSADRRKLKEVEDILLLAKQSDEKVFKDRLNDAVSELIKIISRYED